jgi:hypothetical protein
MTEQVLFIFEAYASRAQTPTEDGGELTFQIPAEHAAERHGPVAGFEDQMLQQQIGHRRHEQHGPVHRQNKWCRLAT